MIVQSEVAHRPKRSQVGVYDATILTVEGESLLSPYDDHACEVLVEGIANRRPIDDSSPPRGFVLDSFDYRKLKLFFVSLLWRAAVTSQPVFHRVKLSAAMEERARQQIVNDDPGLPDEFAVVLAGFHDKLDSGFGILDPVRLRFGHVNYYLFYLNHVLAYIKVDQRPVEDPFDEAVLRPGRPLLFLNRGEFRSSKEFPVMRAAAVRNHEFIPDWWKKRS